MTDMQISVENLVVFAGYLSTVIGGAWAARGMFERARAEQSKQVQDLKDLITAKFSAQDTEIRLLQQAQATAGVGHETRFATLDQMIVQVKEDQARTRNKLDEAIKDIVRLQTSVQHT